MPYIEGIGDELLAVIGIFFFIVLVVLIWFSTFVIEPRFNRVTLFVVDRQTFQDLIGRVRNAGFRIINLNRTPNEAAAAINNNAQNDATNENLGSSNVSVPESDDEKIDEAQNSLTEVNVNSSNNNSSPKQEEQNSFTEVNVNSSNNNPSSKQEESDNVDNLSIGKTNSDPTEIKPEEPSCSSHTSNGKSELSPCSSKPKVSLSSQMQQQAFENGGIDKPADGQTPPYNNGELELAPRSSKPQIAKSATSSKVPVTSQGEHQINDGGDDSNSAARQSAVKNEDSKQAGGSTSTSAKVAESSQKDDNTCSKGNIRIKLKYLDDRQRTVQAPPQQTIGEFKRNHFAQEIAENLMVRLIFNGQELRQDTKPLQAYNIRDSCVIHCLLSQRNQSNTNTALQHPDDEDFSIGAYIFPLFGVILGLIWYSRFTYPRYFNGMATLCLTGISFMYIIALLASFRGHDEHGEFHEHED